VTGKTRDIAAGVGKTGNITAADRIADTNEYDRHFSGDRL
jgi:hypothetical protein